MTEVPVVADPREPYPATRPRPFPLSVEQRTIWLHTQTHEDPGAYTLSLAHRLTGPLDLSALQAAFDEVIARHEALRTGFRLTDEGPVQEVGPPMGCPFTVDTRAPYAETATGSGSEAFTADWQRRMAEQPFDLGRPPLLRVHVLREDANTTVVLVLVHHLVFDGWSVALLLEDLSAAYRSARSGTPALRHAEPALVASRTSYRAHVEAEARRLDPAARRRNIAYWADVLLAAGPDAPFVFDRHDVVSGATDRPARLAAEPFALGDAATEAVTRLAALLDTTRFVVTAALVALALSRLHGRPRVVLGYPTSNRTDEEERTVGLFLDTSALAVDVRDDMSFRALAESVESAHFDALAHLPLEGDRVLAASGSLREQTNTALFSVLFAFQNVPHHTLDLPGIVARRIPGPPRPAEFDLTLAVERTEPHIAGQLERDSRAVGPDDARRVIAAVDALARGAVTAVDGRVGDLPLLGAADRDVVDSVKGPVMAIDAVGLHDLVRRRAQAAGDAAAIVGDGRTVPYATLDAAAAAVAGRLAAHGVGRGHVVGVAMGRSPELVAALLGVLASGAAYVPLDLTYPVPRLRFMVTDCRPSVVLTDPGSAARLDWLDELGVGVSVLETVEALAAPAPTQAPAPVSVHVPAGPEDPAYLIYTSGSTGQPKGVVVPHRAAVNVVRAFDRLIGCGPGDAFHSVTSVSFDIALLELFWPLSTGAQVQLGSPHDPAAVDEELCGRHVTHLQCTPTLATALAADPAWRRRLRGLKHLLIGGEPVPADTVRSLREAFDCEIYNAYGPTEATVWSNARRVEGVDDASLIGPPVANSSAYVVDDRGRLVPPGVRGELCLAGVQLALGYWRRPELTAERFVTGWVPELPGLRLYRTGDLVSLRPDGAFRFHGRLDDQVKVRGHRVEPAEIEAALLAHPDVRAAAVTTVRDATGEARLAAFVVPARDARRAGGADDDPVPGIRRHARQVLPAVMVPASFTLVDALPTTPNGKTDRRALPAPPAQTPTDDAARGDTGRPHDADNTGTDHTAGNALARIWQEVLGTTRVAPGSTFHELGGNSLSAIRVVARARAEGLELPASALLRGDTLAAIAARAVTTGRPAHTAPAAPATGATVPLLPMQHDFFARHRPDHNWANLAGLYVAGNLDTGLLDAALRTVAGRHDALRLSFARQDGRRRQTVTDRPRVTLVTADLPRTPRGAEDAVRAEVRRHQRTLRLDDGPLVKVVVIRLPRPAPPRVLVVAHHLVMDAWSFRLLLDELTDAYERLRAGLPEKPTPAHPSLTFASWAHEVAAAATDPALTGGTGFWEALDLAGVPPLPVDRASGANLAGTADSVEHVLGREHTRALLRPGPQDGVTTQQSLLTAFAAAYHEWCGLPALSVRVLHHGRHGLRPGTVLHGTIGWLSIDYPLVLRPGDTSRTALPHSVGELLDAVPHHGYGYGMLRRLGTDAERQRMSALPRPDISFNYLGPHDVTEAGTGGWQPAPEAVTDRFSPREERGSVLQIRVYVRAGRLVTELQYSRDLHHRHTVQALGDAFARHLRAPASSHPSTSR
ncbi:non-ribosomal peptide synthetase [Streptomyces sp. L2]|uniref:non-ribosomal peptide synthetase n=1 Tax=Streptomyces sp. L2 TaxID=2162665 RepID=UPI00101102C8|nr:non-ribosomal peptide synthetase [Streptomyces sp. L2]